MKKISAGIAHSLIQPELVKVVSYIIMAPDFFLLVLFRCGGENELFQNLSIRGELIHLPQKMIQRLV